MLKDFIHGETDADFFLTYVRAKGDDILSGLMTPAHSFTPELSKRVMSLIRDPKETKAQMKVNKAFERFSDALLSQTKSTADPQNLVSKLLSKLHDQALLSLAKHPAASEQEDSLRKPQH